MTPLIHLFLWSFALSSVISYGWWTILRVRLFRQDLFNIRDRMLFNAEKAPALSAAVYKETREKINAMIRIAPWLSIGLLVHAVLSDRIATIHRADYPEFIWKARLEVNERMVKYIFSESISGLTMLGIMKLYGLSEKVKTRLSAWADRCFDSSHGGIGPECA
jgi:hypothetical protein